MKPPVAPPVAKDPRAAAAMQRRTFGARVREFTGLGRSVEDFFLLLLVVGLFLHWVVASAVLAFASVWVLSSKKRLLSALRPLYPSLFVFGLIILFAVNSLFAANALSAVGFVCIGLCVLVSFWVRSFMTRRRFDRMLDLSLVMSFYSAVYGVAEKFVVHSDEWESFLMKGPTNNANYYGFLLVIWILSAFFRLEQTGWRNRMFFYLTSVLVNFTMLLFTESISSFVGLLLGLMLLLLLYRHYKSFAAMFGGLSALFTLSAVLQKSAWGGPVVYIFTERVEMWRIAWRSISETPRNLLFGQGLFSYQAIWDNASHGFWDVRGIVPVDFQPHAHNLYLEIVLAVGVFGLLLLALYGAAQFWLILHRAKVAGLRPYSLFLLVVCAVVFCVNIADVSVFWMQTGVWFLLLCTSVGIPAARGGTP